MKGLIEVLLFIYLFNKVELYLAEIKYISLMPNDAIILKHNTTYKNDKMYTIRTFTTSINKQFNENDDIFIFRYSNKNSTSKRYQSSFCSANFGSFTGTPNALLGQVWGINYTYGDICPIKGTFHGESLFNVDYATFRDYEPESHHVALEITDISDNLILILHIWSDEKWKKSVVICN